MSQGHCQPETPILSLAYHCVRDEERDFFTRSRDLLLGVPLTMRVGLGGLIPSSPSTGLGGLVPSSPSTGLGELPLSPHTFGDVRLHVAPRGYSPLFPAQTCAGDFFHRFRIYNARCTLVNFNWWCEPRLKCCFF